jgi:hypothetical protein
MKWLLAAAVLALSVLLLWPRGEMISRDMGCAQVAPERARRICESLSATAEWTWMGHAIIAPGWRVTRSSVRRTYCREKVGVDDGAVLEALAKSPDWRLQSGAESLLRLTRDQKQEDAASIFHPGNPQYVLRDGCRGDE